MLNAMKPLETIYWLRLSLGIAVALLCTGYGLATNMQALNLFINGLSLALATYLMSYYIIKLKFQSQVSKSRKLMTTGIGIYIISWMAIWTLLYTIT
uniref:Uncharacterized protein n=1 Tax=uncultured marine crenarchaeote E48-1C TaxID=907718 RepID=G9BAT9_9ARCH|nr:hypothetical protein E48-1C_19 [uncultured marine crenarchaeote E48-1C]